jgi:hypothetical protein
MSRSPIAMMGDTWKRPEVNAGGRLVTLYL